MSELFNACNTANKLTENGAIAHGSTLSECLNLFAAVGASRGKDLTDQVIRAFSEDVDTAVRLMLYSRDPRGGIGERQHFRTFLAWLAERDTDIAKRVIARVGELGRWDDLKCLEGTKSEKDAARTWGHAITTGNSLACKWLPRKGFWFNSVRKYLRLTPKHLRKHIVALSNTVEQLMSANEWEAIELGKVPSVASFRYRKAFARQMPDTYEKWVEGLAKGTEKVNSAVLYPHQIVAACNDDAAADARWAALPDYLEGSTESILPMVDVSGSMCCDADSGSSCMDVAVSLGLYLAERNSGVFRGEFLTFSAEPQFQTVRGSSLVDKVTSMQRADWGMNTNLTAAFDLILRKSKENSLTADQLPSTIVVLSDMEFDSATTSRVWGWGNDADVPKTNFEHIDQMYAESGYVRPKLVFWNLAQSTEHYPVQAGDAGTALVSGFSPALMKAVLSDNLETFTPMSVLLEAVGDSRYDF